MCHLAPSSPHVAREHAKSSWEKRGCGIALPAVQKPDIPLPAPPQTDVPLALLNAIDSDLVASTADLIEMLEVAIHLILYGCSMPHCCMSERSNPAWAKGVCMG